MKRVFSLALAALLLAGCTAAPADGSTASTAVTAETAAAQAPGGNGEPLRLLQGGDEKQYYTETTVDDAEAMLQYHIIDLDSGEDSIPCDVKGCTHNTADCPAVTTKLPSTTPLVIDENTLVALSGPYEAATIFLMDRNCQNRRDLVELDGIYPYWNTRILYTDGESLYFFGAENDGTHLYRVALADGTVTDLSGGHPLESPYLGSIGRDFVLTQSDTTYPDATGDLAADALAHSTGTLTHLLLNIDTGETRELCSYSSDDYVLDRQYFYIIGGQYYWLDSTAGTLSTVDTDTGESRLLTDQLPVIAPDEPPSDYQMEANLNGWLLFYNLPLLVNAETGEVRQRADLPENYWNGYGHQPSIFLQLQDRLLVDCRYEPYTDTVIGTDGTPYDIQTEQMYLGLISIDDFLNGVPNYTEVCKGPY